MEYLKRHEQVETGIHYADPIHKHPLFASSAALPLPVTESLARRMLSLPIQPEVVNGSLPRIVSAIARGLQR